MRARRAACRLGWLFVVAALGIGGCAYYNTFFYAKKYYAKAQRLQAASTTDRLSPEAVRFYDMSIDKCSKVIFTHGGGWRAGIDDALFLMGQCYYGKREYETAIEKFNELLLNYPESDHVTEALFYSGMSYQRLRNVGTASQIFASLLREHPDFEHKDEILFIDAAALEAAGNDAEALGQYRRVIAGFPESRKREEALERVGEIHFAEGNFDSAGAAFAELALTTRDDQLYFEAQLMHGACLVRRGQYAEALSIYERILPAQPERTEQGGRVWLAMAEAHNRAKRHDEALEELGRVVEHFENRALAAEALFLTGYTHEVYLEQYEEARTAYEGVTANPTRSVFQEQAKRRLENLRYLIELQAAGESPEAEEESDLERRAKAALKVAEFTLFESDDPRGALEQYRAVVRDYPQSEAARRAAYAEGWILSEKYDSLAAARAVLTDLVEVHPASGQAEGALGLLAALELPAAHLAQLEARVDSARAREETRADSLAAVQARADSLARVAALGDSLARAAAAEARASADSLAEAEAAVDTLAMIRREDAIADSLMRRSRGGGPPIVAPGSLAVGESGTAAIESTLAIAESSEVAGDSRAAAIESTLVVGEGTAAIESTLAITDSSLAVGDSSAPADSAAAGMKEAR